MQHIDHILYINMDNRPDRKQTIETELIRVGARPDGVTRFPACSYNGCPNTGCLISHANALEMAYVMGYENVLILEDDFIFIDDLEKINNDLCEFFQMVKDGFDWDVIMLTTCAAQVSEFITPNISRISSSGNGAAYLVNRKMMMTISTLFKQNIDNLYFTKEHWNYQNDILWKALMPKSKWFMFNQYLGYQKGGYSDLSQDQKIAIIPQVIISPNK
jgi:GR25 family glycosyltransferase involved in LPS biosynthesis